VCTDQQLLSHVDIRSPQLVIDGAPVLLILRRMNPPREEPQQRSVVFPPTITGIGVPQLTIEVREPRCEGLIVCLPDVELRSFACPM